MSNPAFIFDHIHIISQTPHDTANWYVQMFGAEVVADKVAYGAPQIFLELGNLVIRATGPSLSPSDPTVCQFLQPQRLGTDHFGFLSVTCAPSTTAAWKGAVSVELKQGNGALAVLRLHPTASALS
jgi:hypothetical protein